MKKLVVIFISIVIIIFLGVLYIVNSDNRYKERLGDVIIKNTAIDKIKYINEYDDYYIVMDRNYLYLFDHKYKELLKIDNILISENVGNYDIIYKDKKFMYMNEEYKDKKLIYKYYDLYNYELIASVALGE